MPAWTKSTITTALAPLLLCGSIACGTDYEYEEPDDFPSGSGQEIAASGDLPYAPGPYGISVGSVMPNWRYYGYAHPENDVGGPMTEIQLAEFYNPTGADVYPPGSVMGEGAPKPKALAVVMSAVWCGPCQEEARLILPDQYTKYKPQGGEFMANLADGRGGPADQINLDGWVSSFVVDYPLVFDPNYRLFQVAPEFVWPTNYIVDTRTMRIVMAIAGPAIPVNLCSPSDLTTDNCQFWQVFEEVLAGTYTFPAE